jgi:hypothetical protein
MALFPDRLDRQVKRRHMPIVFPALVCYNFPCTEWQSKVRRNTMVRQHDKIINMAAKKVLAPKGLFRQGTSRTWLDDNGYFVIFVVFDSGNWSKGSYLGVGIDFFWEKSESLNNILSYSYGNRENEFCSYDGNDDEFQAKMEEFAETGLRKVMEYRKFEDMDYAKKCLEQKVSDLPESRRFWEVYDLAMLCFLKGEFENGVAVFENYLDLLEKSIYVGDFYIEWHEIFYKHCINSINSIKPFLTSKEAAQKMVLDMIKRRRDYFNSKSSFKKMNKERFLLH